MGAIRVSMGQAAALARGELTLAFAGAPALLRRALIILVWAVTAILLGCMIGLMAVVLPPLASFGFVGGIGLILLWVAPDVPLVSDKLIRRMFFVAIVVSLCVPSYYSYHGLSPRRLVTYPLVVLFAGLFATSPEARQRVMNVAKDNRWIAICAFGYLVVAFLSVLTSIAPIASFNAALQTFVETYVPFVTLLYLFRNEEDVEKFVRLLVYCAVIIAFVGFSDFILRRATMVYLMPKMILDQMLATFPAMASVVSGMTRGGQFRAISVFNVALSFAEFMAIITAISAVYIVHSTRFSAKFLGLLVSAVCLLGIFVSGSRGGYIAAIVSISAFTFAFVVRSYLLDRKSLASAVFGASGFVGFILGVLAILFVPAVSIRVLGGGVEQLSNEGRRVEWEMGIPKFARNPITGLGYEMGGDIVGYHSPGRDFNSIDSFLLATLVETGLLGTAAFFGAIILSIWVSFRYYITDSSRSAALMGGLGSALTGFGVYRIWLAQRENISLVFFLVGCIMVLNSAFMAKRRKAAVDSASPAP